MAASPKGEGFNLEAYLERVNLADKRASLKNDVETLALVQISHMRSIPFENLDVVLKQTIDMSPAAVERKLVVERRGGYCFEMNTLLKEALLALGFKVRGILSRVRWNKAPDVQTTYTHIILAVKCGDDREYLVDVGFGGLGSLVPLKFDGSAEPQDTPDGPYRVVESNGWFTVEWLLDQTWTALYTFQNQEALWCDLLLSNWWSCTHPEARWCTCLFAARIVGNDRHHLLNNEYVVRSAVTGKSVRTQIETRADHLELLNRVFTLSFPTETRFVFPGCPWQN